MEDNYIKNISWEVREIRRHFHKKPELSLKEYETSIYIRKYLKDIGLNPKIIGNTGVVAIIIKDNSLPVIGIRAEIDALPIVEENNIDYKSENNGVMHACSHDAITATLLGVAKMLVENKDKLNSNIKLIFQPGEETGGGSKLLIDEGVLENPKVDKLIFFHYSNDKTLGMDIQKDMVSACVGSINIKVKGKATHWSEFEKGIDAIRISGRILNVIENINTYNMGEPFILGIGKIKGGSSRNIVAEEVELDGTLRTVSIEVYNKLALLLKEEILKIEEEIGLSIVFNVSNNPLPPMYNSKKLIEKGKEIGEKVFKENFRIEDKIYLSGDNASLYFKDIEGLFIAFTAKEEGKENYPLHNSKFNINEEIFPYALKVLYNLILNIYKR